jgi:hypothetical protein
MSTSFPPFIHMFSTAWFRLSVCAWLLSVCASVAAAQDAAAPATLYRVFLRDGSTVVSYGEYARVGDRVVVSLPLGGTEASPELQLLSLPADAVDWEQTDAYAESARATRYAQTRGPDDFALLNEAVSRALTDIALTQDPQRKIAMAAEARQNVTKWAAEHFAYRAKNVGELAGLFDAVIAEARSSGGMPNFDLSLVANMAEPPSVPLLPLPTPQESVEQALRAASLAPDAAERTSLLRSISKVLGTIDRSAAWAEPLRIRVDMALAAETRTDNAYNALIHDTLRLADRYARAADVSGVERVVRRVLREDDRLGQRRPNEMASALAALDARLDAARRLRLARDSFAARVEVLRAYQAAIAEPVAAMRASRAALDEIQRLAGPSRARLLTVTARTTAAMTQLRAAVVPAEAAPAHDLLRNALMLAGRAADGRLKAIASGDMHLAWEASSAAAGAMMLFGRAAEALKELSANIPRPPGMS